MKFFKYFFITLSLNVLFNVRSDYEESRLLHYDSIPKNSQLKSNSGFEAGLSLIFIGAVIGLCSFGLWKQGENKLQDIPTTLHDKMLMAMRGAMREQDLKKLEKAQHDEGENLQTASLFCLATASIFFILGFGFMAS